MVLLCNGCVFYGFIAELQAVFKFFKDKTKALKRYRGEHQTPNASKEEHDEANETIKQGKTEKQQP